MLDKFLCVAFFSFFFATVYTKYGPIKFKKTVYNIQNNTVNLAGKVYELACSVQEWLYSSDIR